MQLINHMLLSIGIICIPALSSVYENDTAQGAPWEPPAAVTIQMDATIDEKPTSNPLTLAMLAGIEYYKQHISPNSTRRCPYKLSCSNFAIKAIHTWGPLGIIPFIDRFFYRENEQIPARYTEYRIPNTYILRYDDELFLP